MARLTFDEAYSIGRRKAFFLWKKRKNNFLLSLHELTAVVQPGSSYSVGIQDVPVEKIIGSENRSNDFAAGFYPVRLNMEVRWKTIRSLMLKNGIAEALSLLEYGNMYFVRDGNHRVSVAKTNDISYITANIVRLDIPVSLPQDMTRKDIPLFKAKYAFYMDTHVFDYIPEENFAVACPENWEFLKKEIFHYNKQWFIRKHGREPQDEELIRNWNFMLYDSTMKHIRRNGLTFLFNGKRETDIFCDIIRLWNSYDDPDTKWFQEIYDMYVEKALKKRWFRAIPMNLKKMYAGYTMSADEERALFLRHIKLLDFYPEAVIPEGNKEWYRFLTDHVLRRFFFRMKKRMQKKRVPYLEELVREWYDTLFLPALDFYGKSNSKKDFPAFYTKWARRYLPKLYSSEEEITRDRLEQSFRKVV